MELCRWNDLKGAICLNQRNFLEAHPVVRLDFLIFFQGQRDGWASYNDLYLTLIKFYGFS